MDVDDLKSFLKLQVVSKDEHMFELKVTASNGRYFGTTNVFDTPELVLKFAQTLISFPQHNSDLFYETGFKNGQASFSMHFYHSDNTAHFVLGISLEDHVTTAYTHEHKNKLKIEISIEPNAVDEFKKDLSRLATEKDGIAILYGRDSTTAI